MIRLRNGTLARMMHAHLYKRMLEFAKVYSPELPGEFMVESWLARLYANDEYLHILVQVEDNPITITEHAVIDIHRYGTQCVVVCHQTQHNTPELKSFNVLVEYVDKLSSTINAHSAFFYTKEHIQAYSHYDYLPVSTLLMKKYHDG